MREETAKIADGSDRLDEDKMVRVDWEYPSVKWWDIMGRIRVRRCKKRMANIAKSYGF